MGKPDAERERIVYIYTYTYMEANGRVQLLAYLRRQTGGACVHCVIAASGPEAKRLAIGEHKACIPLGLWKSAHPNGHVGGVPCTCPPRFVPPRIAERPGRVE